MFQGSTERYDYSILDEVTATGKVFPGQMRDMHVYRLILTLEPGGLQKLTGNEGIIYDGYRIKGHPYAAVVRCDEREIQIVTPISRGEKRAIEFGRAVLERYGGNGIRAARFKSLICMEEMSVIRGGIEVGRLVDSEVFQLIDEECDTDLRPGD